MENVFKHGDVLYYKIGSLEFITEIDQVKGDKLSVKRQVSRSPGEDWEPSSTYIGNKKGFIWRHEVTRYCNVDEYNALFEIVP